MKTLIPAIGGALLVAVCALSAPAMAAGTHYYGGPIYFGEPALPVVAAVLQSGGGPQDFSFPNALVTMLGKIAAQAEINNLSKTYGQDHVNTAMSLMTFAVRDAVKRAAEAHVKLPEATPDLKGEKLVTELVKLGIAPDGTFWAGYFFDRLITHDLHRQVMLDMNAQFGSVPVSNSYRILNQAMYDLAQQLGMKDVKLASFH